jgi:hypothetical protein
MSKNPGPVYGSGFFYLPTGKATVDVGNSVRLSTRERTPFKFLLN